MIDETKFNEEEFIDNLVTWADLAKDVKQHEKALVVIYLPKPIEQCGRMYTAICLVKLKNGERASVLMNFDNGIPSYCCDENVMSNFMKE